jgi:hypothetical protein
MISKTNKFINTRYKGKFVKEVRKALCTNGSKL